MKGNYAFNHPDVIEALAIDNAGRNKEYDNDMDFVASAKEAVADHLEKLYRENKNKYDKVVSDLPLYMRELWRPGGIKKSNTAEVTEDEENYERDWEKKINRKKRKRSCWGDPVSKEEGNLHTESTMDTSLSSGMLTLFSP